MGTTHANQYKRWAQPTLRTVGRRNTESQIEAPGKDSFLDVVANVVAILIILVIVVGSQASKVVVDRETAKQRERASAAEGSSGEIAAAEDAVKSIEAGVHELEARVDRQKFEVAMRRAEREQMQLLVTVAEQRLGEHRDQLSDAERQRYDLEGDLIASRGELSKLSLTAASKVAKPAPIVLQHLPTPMARTVFDNEVHFRLQNHRLAYVPFDEMKERLMTDARNQLSKLKDTPRAEFSLPEIAGFGARYILRRAETEVETRSGTARHSGVELELIYFVDVEPNLGEPFAQAMGPSSEFRSRIAGRRPQNTTVTIWVYPDSFDDFRALKAELFRLGFLTAARPMPMGEPIAGGPSGHRSAAE